jgi:hypothetical protein
MTFKEIIDQPGGKVSRYLPLVHLHSLMTDARDKAQVLKDTSADLSPDEQLMIRWFNDLADSAERKMHDVNEHSVEGYIHG